MKILVVVQGSPVQRYVARLLDKELVREIKELISNKKHSRAITMVLAKGEVERSVLKDEFDDIKADLILSEHSANWDIMK